MHNASMLVNYRSLHDSLGNASSVCNFCNFPSKLFTETAETNSSSKEFQRLITRSIKKC